MQINLTAEDDIFRSDVRQFLDDHLDADLRRAGELASGICGDHEQTMRWHKILHDKGWVAPNWPVAFGGTGWSVIFGLMNAPAPMPRVFIQWAWG
jgi:alkylation response protein AidB-like acyl-CoA dehydrogenase